MMGWRLTVSAVTNKGELDAEKLVNEINKAIDSFDSGGKLRTQFITVHMAIGSTPEAIYPLRLRLSDKAWRPSGVVVAKIVPINSADSRTPIYAGPTVDWENGFAGEINIKYVAGLEANSRYDVTFLVLGDA